MGQRLQQEFGPHHSLQQGADGPPNPLMDPHQPGPFRTTFPRAMARLPRCPRCPPRVVGTLMDLPICSRAAGLPLRRPHTHLRSLREVASNLSFPRVVVTSLRCHRPSGSPFPLPPVQAGGYPGDGPALPYQGVVPPQPPPPGGPWVPPHAAYHPIGPR